MIETIYTDDLALLAYTPTQAVSQPHKLEQAAGGIGLYVNENISKNKDIINIS